MIEKHVQEKLSAYLNYELPKEERQTIAEHLLQCENCRNEHDAIKFGAALANRLQRFDAPPKLWKEIEIALETKQSKQNYLIPAFSFFKARGLTTAAAILIGCGLLAALYAGLFRNKSPEIARNESAAQPVNIEPPLIAAAPSSEHLIDRDTQTAQVAPTTKAHEPSLPAEANLNNTIQPLLETPEAVATKPAKKSGKQIIEPNKASFWDIETLAGSPTAGNRMIAENDKLAVGQFLETDARSRARVQVANIGQVEVAPNSRVQLVKTASTEHRLWLERGRLKAQIFAPPRLFIVDTPSAAAIDLGCEYTLEVDADGSSRLHVTSGFVALEHAGRQSIVPAGAICLTKKGKGLGTPFSAEASLKLQEAIFNFDFANGGSASIDAIIKESNVYDTVTLWHLLARVPKTEREKVFDALVSFIKLPEGATRQGVLSLDKKMLDRWWSEIENVWFE